MLTLRIELPHGLYRAAEPADERMPEWPPAPDRVYQALVASACAQGLDPQPLTALEHPPEVWCGVAEQVINGDNYVPGAFLTGSAKARRRTAVPRQRPELRVTDPVYLRWPRADSALAGWIGPVLAGVDYLGRSDSPAIFSLADTPAQYLTRLTPDADGELSLRVPLPGRLDALRQAHAALLRAPEATRLGYTAEPDAASSPWGELFVLRCRRGTLTQTVRLTAQLRAATMSQAEDPMPAVLHGHRAPDGQSARDADHAAWLALPDIGHRYARGAVLGLGMLLPRRTDAHERDACAMALHRVRRIDQTPLTRLTAADPTPQALRLRTWARPARDWRTVTPIVLDRHPKRGQDVATLIADNAERAGYPRPSGVEIIPAPWPHVPAAGAFLGRGPGHRVHALLRFAAPVRGPMLIGRGRYFGLGLLRGEVH